MIANGAVLRNSCWRRRKIKNLMRAHDEWLVQLQPDHHLRKQIELTLAKSLAKEWRLGWYVAPHGNHWRIGKMTIVGPYQRFVVTDDDGKPLAFEGVDNALAFFRKEFGLFGVAMFQS